MSISPPFRVCRYRKPPPSTTPLKSAAAVGRRHHQPSLRFVYFLFSDDATRRIFYYQVKIPKNMTFSIKEKPH
ncbi:hypothetical protein QVD17_32773 [Tagetes erecta]|uniref:Uncharacterized protein n=1 Tax=Tagetes erecta TaxID=13708 RepID=A0AAD8NKY4_TARER|nr:hypothetical protein QVD17_32773 [Tagetes erecta]